MKRVLVVTMEVQVEDFTAAERREFAIASECEARDLPGVNDADPFDIADAIAGSLPINEELFGGTDIYVKIADAKRLPTSGSESGTEARNVDVADRRPSLSVHRRDGRGLDCPPAWVARVAPDYFCNGVLDIHQH